MRKDSDRKQRVIFIDDSGTESNELIAGGRVKFTHARNMTLADWHFEVGTLLPEHSHKHEQITKVISGEFELITEDEKYTLSPGDSVIIPPHIRHSGRALAQCRLIDVFYPMREDYV